MAEDQIPNGPHFLVIVPGYIGSKLRDKKTGEIVWIDFPGLLRDPIHLKTNLDRTLDYLMYPNSKVEPAVRKQTGRGKPSSQLRFDYLQPVKKVEAGQ